MSKSLGNGIDPLEVIDKYGADALRLTLITGNAPGNDMRFYWERVESSRNFANKVWNASRFIMMNLEGAAITEPSADELQPADKWILSKVNTLAKDVTENMDKYEMGIAVQKVYDFIWDEFCDWYIEITKTRTYNKEQDPVSANAAFWTLKTVLTEALKPVSYTHLPGEFIPILEESGLIIPVGRWVLRQALDACREWQKILPEFKVNVNLSYVQVLKSRVLTDVRRIVDEFGVKPSSVCIELTESGYLEENLSLIHIWLKTEI